MVVARKSIDFSWKEKLISLKIDRELIERDENKANNDYYTQP